MEPLEDDFEVLSRFDLSGRVALVTGAASGIGQTAAVVLDRLGADVVCMGRPGGSPMESTFERLRASQRPLHVEADVTDDESVKRAVDSVIEGHERLDILVNAAGIGGRGKAAEYPMARWRDVIATNLTGAFVMCREVSRWMLKAGSGSIINVSSIGGIVGYSGSVGYQASKGGLNQLTRSLAIEWADSGIRVNAIAPCQIRTKMSEAQWDADPTVADFFRERTPLRGYGRLDDLIGPVAFLASDASSLVTGQILAVDGGFTAQ